MNAPLEPTVMGLPADAAPVDGHFNFAYLDERTKRMIRRAILKAVAIPGYQVPFGSREMPPVSYTHLTLPTTPYV